MFRLKAVLFYVRQYLNKGKLPLIAKIALLGVFVSGLHFLKLAIGQAVIFPWF